MRKSFTAFAVASFAFVGLNQPHAQMPAPPEKAHPNQKPMDPGAPMAGEMRKPGMMKGDMPKRAADKKRYMKEMMREEESKTGKPQK